MNILGIVAGSIKIISGGVGPFYPYPLNASEGYILAATGGTYGKLTPSADEQTGSVVVDTGLATNNKALVGEFITESPLVPNLLNDMSAGNGNFGFEVHVTYPETNAPLTDQLGFAGVQLRDSGGVAFLQAGDFSRPGIIPANYKKVIGMNLYDDVDGKKVDFYDDDIISFTGVDVNGASNGLDLSGLFAFMYIQAGVNPVDAGKFVSDTPEISARLVTTPSEMVYGTENFRFGTKTITGNGYVVPYGPDVHLANVVSLMRFDDSLDLYADEVAGNTWTPAATPSIYSATGKFDGGITIPALVGESMAASAPIQSTANSLLIPVLDGDYTVEFYIRFAEAPANGYSVPFLRLDNVALDTGIRIVLSDPPSGAAGQQILFTTTSLTGTNTGNSARVSINPSEFEHFVLQREGNNTFIFRNGIRHPDPVATTFNGNFDRIYLGHVGGNWSQWKEFTIDELRITKGVARYPTSFVPEPVPYPSVIV